MLKAVIGVGYGDEGKGATVNHLSTPNSIVVRFNGGAQAGHTVIHNGFRHVFSSIGSGTLKGASTHLSKYFVVEPFGFNREFEHLSKNGFSPKVSVDPNCYVTIPYDIYINQKLEQSRGQNKHGSVGIGFGETIERSENGISILVKDLLDEKLLWKKIHEAGLWGCDRFITLGLGTHFLDRWFDWHKFVDECKLFLERITIKNDYDILSSPNLLFEGAQGLMLDPEYGTMPYCTRSNCGLKNIEELLGHIPYDIYYVSRPYTTRHGAGPLPFEDKNLSYEDKTNQPHLYQENLRFAPLNIDGITNVTKLDSEKYGKNIAKKFAVMTCLDQISNKVNVIKNGKLTKIKKEDVIEEYSQIGEFVGFSNKEYL